MTSKGLIPYLKALSSKLCHLRRISVAVCLFNHRHVGDLSRVRLGAALGADDALAFPFYALDAVSASVAFLFGFDRRDKFQARLRYLVSRGRP